YQCCEQQHPQGLRRYRDLWWNAWGQCKCEVPGYCAGPCSGEYCLDGSVSAGSACDQCLIVNNCDTQAYDGAKQACLSGGGDCAALLACDQTNGCASKP